MKNSIITSYIKKFFSQIINKEKGFKLVQGTFLKEVNDILQIISIFSSNGNIYCDVAMQPLYIPQKVVVLSLGFRLDYSDYKKNTFKTVESLDELDIQLIHINKFLEDKVFPWFNKYSTPKGLIEFIEENNRKPKSLLLGFSPFIKNLYLGFSYLYNKEYENGYEKLKLVIHELKETKFDWAMELKNLINYILEVIDTRPEKISLILQEYIKETKLNLKL